jgi:AcrR family transcriptional regulator
MSLRTDQARATRGLLIETARAFFAAHGFDATSLEQVQRQAGVSRGALYHHFTNKRALFEAALDAIEGEVGARIAAAAAEHADPLDRLRAGSLAWLELAADPGVQRIALLDAPSVLGWETQREVDKRHALGMISTVLAEVTKASGIPDSTIEPLSHALLATLNELGLYVACASDHRAAEAAATEAVEVLLGRLFARPDAAAS